MTRAVQADFALGNSGSDMIPKSLSPSSPPSIPPVSITNWDADLSGDLSIHIVPQVQMGINVLDGALINAQVSCSMYIGKRYT